MPIIKSKTITASGWSKGPMQFDHKEHEDGKWYVHYSQVYQFTDENNLPVTGLQNKFILEGEIEDAVLQNISPDIWTALSSLWTFFDNEIKKQEGIT